MSDALLCEVLNAVSIMPADAPVLLILLNALRYSALVLLPPLLSRSALVPATRRSHDRFSPVPSHDCAAIEGDAALTFQISAAPRNFLTFRFLLALHPALCTFSDESTARRRTVA
eukprot:5393730-Pleurochrysis_carterae.AAC.1